MTFVIVILVLTVALLIAVPYALICRADASAWERNAQTWADQLNRELNELNAARVDAAAERERHERLIADMRAEALAERQDLYRRIQAPETGSYVMHEQQIPAGQEKKLHISEDDEIRRAMGLVDELAAGGDFARGPAPPVEWETRHT